MDFKITKEIDNYIELNSDSEPEILYNLRRETYQKSTHPHMLSGHLQGRLLSMLSKFIAPNIILEIGTFTGYSTLCLAEGLQEGGRIITIDNNEETAYLPEKYFAISKYSANINFIKTHAIEYIPTIKENLDLVFIDADKENYINYLNLIKPLLKSGGLIIADNILWKGRVLEENGDIKTELIKKFNKKVKEDKSLEVVILPIRDGISLIRKK